MPVPAARRSKLRRSGRGRARCRRRRPPRPRRPCGRAGSTHARSAADDERHLARQSAALTVPPRELVVLPRQVLTLASVPRRRLRDRILVDLDAEAGAVDRSPARACRDRDRLGEDVVLHQVGGLLVALDAVWQRQHDVMARRGGEAELAVGVLADLQPFVMRDPGEPVEAADRPDPVRREAVDVGLPRTDARVRLGLRPQALVRADHRRGAGAQLGELPDRVIAHGLLDEVDVVRGERSEVPERLRHRPAPFASSRSRGRGPSAARTVDDHARGPPRRRGRP